MEIRRAEASEAETLSAIARASKAHWPYAPEQIEAWREDLVVTSKDIVTTPVYALEEKGGIAGFFQLLPQGECWTLEHFWVAPEHMGKGLGRSLFEYAVAIAGEGGAHRIAIDADPHAEAFYCACGATTQSVVAAPIAGEPHRLRPQMTIDIAVPRTIAYLHLLPGSAIPASPLPYPFKAVLISETQAGDAWKASVCKWLVESGCLYAMTWGVDCESWHDFVDLANLEQFDFGDIPESHFIMTTFHKDDPMGEVFNFAKRQAWHATVETPDTLILHIAVKAGAEELKKEFARA